MNICIVCIGHYKKSQFFTDLTLSAIHLP